MKRTGKCPKCGSTDVIADVITVDRGHLNAEHELSLVTYQHPKALLFKGKKSTALAAWVCARCGFVELYADEPEKMRGPDADEE